MASLKKKLTVPTYIHFRLLTVISFDLLVDILIFLYEKWF
jgi:hypothetical protein